MNERIKQLAEQAEILITEVGAFHNTPQGAYQLKEQHMKKFAELIVRDCLNIAKNWDDQLVNANLVKESNAVGIVAYRIARQFGVEE
jgi:hypothetical protein